MTSLISSSYTIPAIVTKWGHYDRPTPEQVAKGNAEEVARKEGIATLLRTLFPTLDVFVAKQNWILPYIRISESDHSFQITITDNGYLQLTYKWGYHGYTKVMRRLKITRSGELDLIDKAKADSAAAEIMASRNAALARESASQSAAEVKLAKDRVDFGVVYAALLDEGVVVNPWKPVDGSPSNGGEIPMAHGRIRIEGKVATLFSGSSSYGCSIKVELIPEFVALFARNAN